jgi:hypothetical protein
MVTAFERRADTIAQIGIRTKQIHAIDAVFNCQIQHLPGKRQIPAGEPFAAEPDFADLQTRASKRTNIA